MFDSPLDEVISALFESYTESIGHISDTSHPDDTFITVKTPATLYDNLTASEAHHEMEKIARVFAKFIDKHLYDQLIARQTMTYPALELWNSGNILKDISMEPSSLYYPLKLYSYIHQPTVLSTGSYQLKEFPEVIHMIGTIHLNHLNLAIQYIGEDIITKYKITHDVDNYTMQFKVTFPENCKIHIITNVS